VDEIDDVCPHCGSSALWLLCDYCGGDGEHNVYELDPLYYDPEETERCERCDGKGGWLVCLSHCQRSEVP
jgi:hypothetical protein